MWHLAVYALILIVVGIVAFEGLKHLREQRAKASAEKAAEEAGLTVEARERMVNELLFTPSLEEITQHALTVARDRGKHQTNKDNVQTPEGFFIGTWSDRLHILYTEAIASDQGIREFPAFYDAGLNTFAKRRESLEKLVQKYRVVRHPSDFHRNYRIAQEYFEPILIQMCARPNSERGKLKEAELEAFADALRLSHTLCPGSWRGLSELIRFFAQDMATDDIDALSLNTKKTLKVIASRQANDKDHRTTLLVTSLAKTVIARLSRKCSFADAFSGPLLEQPQWHTLWCQVFKSRQSGPPQDEKEESKKDIPVTPDQRRLCSYTECFEVEGRPEEKDGGKPKHFMRCSKCKVVAYCSVECQAKHWKAGHKSQCAELARKNPLVAQSKKAAATTEESKESGLKERKKAATASR